MARVHQYLRVRHTVILAGGGGTRLWPASRRSCPKQFLKLIDRKESLLAATARRLAATCEDRVWVVTAAEQTHLVRSDLPQLQPHAIVAEPSARNTAAALGLAAVRVLHRDKNAVMAAIPSDQHIGDEVAFRRVVDEAFTAAETHPAIVCVGIVPSRPETGYGYLKKGRTIAGGLSEVAAFVEKPDLETAQQYVASGDYLWNGGMFFVRAQHLLDEIREHMPETFAGLQEIQKGLQMDDFDAVCASIYPQLPAISIDYGVMEKSRSVLSLDGDFGWNDVGSWASLADTCAQDDDGNVSLGQTVLIDAHNNVAVGDAGTVVALCGVQDLIVVQSGNGVLVLPKERAQDVKLLVAAMRAGTLDEVL